MRRTIVTGVVVLAAALSLAAAAKSKAPPKADTGFDVRRVAPGVYAVIRRNPPGFLFDCNAGFVVGRDGVAVIDGQFTTVSARQVIAALRKITKKPVRYFINTHSHDDHVSGNQAWRDAFPDARFIAHEETATDMKGGYLERRGRLADDLGGALGQMRGALASGKGGDGAPLLAETRARLENDVALGARYVIEAPAFRLIPPDRTFKDSLALSLGDREIELRFLGRAHTAGDIVVEAGSGVIFSGDLVVWPVPLAGTTSYPLEYAATLEGLRRLPHRAIVPGHGPVMRDDAYLVLLTRLMGAIRDQTRAAVARGDSLPQAREKIDLAEFRKAIAGDSRVKNQLFEGYVVQPGIARAYEQAAAEKK